MRIDAHSFSILFFNFITDNLFRMGFKTWVEYLERTHFIIF